ncbi:MAG: hypothetical protein DRH10_00720 [Deltaproteobacteria bacterium]|nr:MAG: hypothetical protein DRH10_00720 [Deltaproteobacteria bacterium]RLC88366.1 MAG: hypothetical protein DRJ03_02935 [Chloroflexota bacterium]
MATATQGALGSRGSRPTTELLNFNYNSLVTLRGFSFGANSDGIYRVNVGDLIDGKRFNKVVTFATSDFSIHNNKQVYFVYIGIYATKEFTLTVTVDKNTVKSCKVKPASSGGLQLLKVPIWDELQGRYWRISLSTLYDFMIDDIRALVSVRPAGEAIAC